MKDLIRLKEEGKIAEKRESQLLLRYIKQQSDRFEFADISQQLAYEKNLEDTMILNDALTNWASNPKLPKEKQKELNDLLLGLWRIMSYCNNIETTIKFSVSKYVTTEKRNTELVSENKTLELKMQQLELLKNKEIEALKKEVEFLSK